MFNNYIFNFSQLKNITCTDHELKEFEIDLKLALKLLFEKSISCSNSMPINDSFKLVNEVIEQIKILNQEIVSLNIYIYNILIIYFLFYF